MTDAEAKALFQAFAEPIFWNAKAAAARPMAESLARSLWLALLTGPEIEQTIWELLKEKMHLDDESLDLVREVYTSKMKPQISPEQLAALRLRYKIQRKS